LERNDIVHLLGFLNVSKKNNEIKLNHFQVENHGDGAVQSNGGAVMVMQSMQRGLREF